MAQDQTLHSREKQSSKLGVQVTRPVTKTSDMSFIVLSDLRFEPLLIARHLFLSLGKPRVLMSSASLCRGDYGDRRSAALRWIRFALFRLLVPVEVVCGSGKTHAKEACRGCMSSLVSLTLDENARPADHPRIWARLNRLCEGAHAVAERIGGNSCDIYLFNGRLASVRPVARLNRSESGPRVHVYEWGPRGGTFYLDRYPWHDPARVSTEMADFAVRARFESDSLRAEKFAQRKINNHYVTGRNDPSSRAYKTVIFAGSQHEYRWSLDNRNYLDAQIPALLSKAMAHHTFAKPAALKLHPNSTISPQFQKNERDIEHLCKRLGVDLIRADSSISPMRLILAARTVMVGASTISLDAFLLGKMPVFLGDNPYRGIIEAAAAQFGPSENAAIRVAGCAAEFYDSKVVQMSDSSAVLGRLFRIWLANYRKLKRPRLRSTTPS